MDLLIQQNNLREKKLEELKLHNQMLDKRLSEMLQQKQLDERQDEFYKTYFKKNRHKNPAWSRRASNISVTSLEISNKESIADTR
jgi:acyl-CoA hydrolase